MLSHKRKWATEWGLQKKEVLVVEGMYVENWDRPVLCGAGIGCASWQECLWLVGEGDVTA